MEKPLYGVELFVGETARFEIELSEPDVHGQWKLKGEPLTASPVSQDYLTTHAGRAWWFGVKKKDILLVYNVLMIGKDNQL